MSESKEERTKRYARKLSSFRDIARETRNDGQAVKSYNAALKEGSTPKATSDLKPLFDQLVLVVD